MYVLKIDMSVIQALQNRPVLKGLLSHLNYSSGEKMGKDEIIQYCLTVFVQS